MTEKFEPFDCPGCGARIESDKVARFHKDDKPHEPEPAPPPEPPPTPTPAPTPPAPKPKSRFDFSTTLFDDDERN